MRRPLVPLPNRPNPTDPGDAADLSIPQGYQYDSDVRGPRTPMEPRGLHASSTASGNLTQPPRKSTIYLVDSGENPINLKH